MKQDDNYNNTTEAILAYIQRIYDHGSDIMEALDELVDKHFTGLMPKKMNVGDQASKDEQEVATMILQKEVRNM